jgi:hypothetical protein
VPDLGLRRLIGLAPIPGLQLRAQLAADSAHRVLARAADLYSIVCM